MEYDVITIGSTTRDVFLKTPEFKIVESGEFKDEGKYYRTGKAGCFMLGTKMGVPEVAITSGGGGTNTAVGFARQGFKTACIGRVGDDVTGQSIIEELKKEGIDSLFQVDKERDTAYSTILVAKNGERTILEYRGANDYMNADDVDWDNLKSKWLYIDSLGGKEELLVRALQWAKDNNVKVAYNPGKKMVELGIKLHKYLDSIDIFLANEDESAFIAGIEYQEEKESEIFKEMDRLVKGIVVMSKGPKGVEVSDGKAHFVAGIPDSPVVDRTGAGDSFGSGFVSGYIHSDGDVEISIQAGTANATSVVKYFGSKKGLLKKDDFGEYGKVKVETRNA